MLYSSVALNATKRILVCYLAFKNEKLHVYYFIEYFFKWKQQMCIARGYYGTICYLWFSVLAIQLITLGLCNAVKTSFPCYSLEQLVIPLCAGSPEDCSKAKSL